MDVDLQKLIRGLLKRDQRSLAKAITYIEEENPIAEQILQSLVRFEGKALCIGVVGPFGTGKSTLIDGLIRWFRKGGKEVAVVAVDPSSPVSGGAFLGDRVRMVTHSADESVFIRSMASRGRLGGLSKATRAAIRVLDAAGYDLIFIETVGAGQSDVEISSVADVVLVVLMPQLGDQIQSMKAGLLEVGDIYVINKADLAGAELTEAILRTSIRKKEASIPVFKTVATEDEGLDSVAEAILQFKKQLDETGQLSTRRRQRIAREILELVSGYLEQEILKDLRESEDYRNAVQKVLERSWDPYHAARNLFHKIKPEKGRGNTRRDS